MEFTETSKRGIDPKLATAVVVTRGNRDLTPVLASLHCFGEVRVWDNSKQRDLKVYGRYVAGLWACNSIIYTQDDDAITVPEQICAEYEPGKLACNMKPGHHEAYRGTGMALVGHGAIFDQNMIDLSPYVDKYGTDELLYRECDRVFTYLHRDKQKWLALPITDLEYASDPETAMWMEKRHGDDLAKIRRRLQTL